MDKTCDWCGAPKPRWLKHVDSTPVDAAWRHFHAAPGPTSHAVRACDACLPKMEAAYPSEGSR